MTKIRILLADDHPVVREGLKRLIEQESDRGALKAGLNSRVDIVRFALAKGWLRLD